MAYFNHAYQKAFYAKSIEIDTAKTTVDLTTPGKFGVYDANTYSALVNAADVDALATTGIGGVANTFGSSQKFILANASWNQTDTLGGNANHGGYAESIKSKDIQFRHITRMNEMAAQTPTSEVAVVRVFGYTNSVSCFPCGSDPMIRIDIKGADALRMLNHNAYRNVDIGGICDCCNAADTTPAGTYMDPNAVVAKWAANIKADPILSKLIDTTQADFFSTTADGGTTWTDSDPADWTCSTTWNSNYGARIKLYMGVVDTAFGNCSFDTRDWVNKEPLRANVEYMPDDGVACEKCNIIEHTPWSQSTPGTPGPLNTGPTTYGSFRFDTTTVGVIESVEAIVGRGNGTDMVNDLLLTQNYMQSPFNQGNRDSARFRTIEGSDLVLAAVDVTDHFYQFQLQHNVPRFNNPTGTFDNDQYVYTVYMADGDAGGIAALSTIWDQIAVNAGVTNTTI